MFPSESTVKIINNNKVKLRSRSQLNIKIMKGIVVIYRINMSFWRRLFIISFYVSPIYLVWSSPSSQKVLQFLLQNDQSEFPDH